MWEWQSPWRLTRVLKQRSTMLALSALLVLSAGCVSVPLDQARQQFEQGQYQDAVDILSGDGIRAKDKLLALMEKGLIQHQAGNYANSSKTFLEASALLESSDYVSISEQGSALLVNDRATTYRGEYAERLWIHTYQMMNFLLLDNAESAAVEARQALAVFGDFEESLSQDWFTRALTAVAFDAAGLPNDAYIEYKKLAKLMPSPEPVVNVLYQRARQLGFADDAMNYAKQVGKPLPTRRDKDGQLIMFVARGSIPTKRPGDLYVYPDVRISFPYYPPDNDVLYDISVSSDSIKQPVTTVSTNLGEVARTSLAARGKSIAARQAARAVSKHALVKAAESESETGAALLNALLFVLEIADTRGWETLPANLSVIRVPLSPGSHDIVVSTDFYNSQDTTAPSAATLSIDIKPGQTIFRKLRF